MAFSNVFALGKDSEGKLICLYVGHSYADGEKTVYEAGQSGRILEGWVYSDPVPQLHQFYAPKVKRGPGRPPKVETETFTVAAG